MYPTLFLIASLLLFLVGIALGTVLAFRGFFFHIIVVENLKWFYLGLLIIPLTPIIMTMIELLRYIYQENSKFKQLKTVVSDFEEFKKKSGKRTKKN